MAKQIIQKGKGNAFPSLQPRPTHIVMPDLVGHLH